MITRSIEERMKEEAYWTAKIQLDLFRQIEDYLEETGMTRSAFAEKLGVSKGYISQILNGDFDHKLSKLVKLLLAIDKVPQLSFKALDLAISQAKGEVPKIFVAYKSPPQEVEFEIGGPASPDQIKLTSQKQSLTFNLVA